MHGCPRCRCSLGRTFEHVFSLPSPRADAPMHLVPAPKPTLPPDVEASRPLNDLQQDIAGVLSHLTGVPDPSGAGAGAGAAGSGGRPMLQGGISEWFRARTIDHAVRTTEWQASKATNAGDGLPIVCQAIPKAGWREHAWTAAGAVEHAEPAYVVCTAPTQPTATMLALPPRSAFCAVCTPAHPHTHGHARTHARTLTRCHVALTTSRRRYTTISTRTLRSPGTGTPYVLHSDAASHTECMHYSWYCRNTRLRLSTAIASIHHVRAVCVCVPPRACLPLPAGC